MQPPVRVEPVQLRERAFQRYRLVLVEFSRERMVRRDRSDPEQGDASECKQLRHGQPPSGCDTLRRGRPTWRLDCVRARVFEKRGAT